MAALEGYNPGMPPPAIGEGLLVNRQKYGRKSGEDAEFQSAFREKSPDRPPRHSLQKNSSLLNISFKFSGFSKSGFLVPLVLMASTPSKGCLSIAKNRPGFLLFLTADEQKDREGSLHPVLAKFNKTGGGAVTDFAKAGLGEQASHCGSLESRMVNTGIIVMEATTI